MPEKKNIGMTPHVVTILQKNKKGIAFYYSSSFYKNVKNLFLNSPTTFLHCLMQRAIFWQTFL